jgi:hypothetical protein
METTTFLAQFWGWLMVLSCLTFLFRKQMMKEMLHLMKDKGFVLLTGFMALILGLVTVLLHNVWVADWPVIITIFGWISIIKGVTRMGFPEATQKMVSNFTKNPTTTNVLLVIGALVGVWMIWVS